MKAAIVLLSFRKKPLEYISSLVAHEGTGSILAYLKKRFAVYLHVILIHKNLTFNKIILQLQLFHFKICDRFRS